ncbi:MAG: tRNA (adenosine(37)-N6)-threonylcarbamoyltransferase complex dimerization subunit type 1 TsaB [Flavobacteriaceae bacterium]|jgi:universal bacterial protein yeaZ
MKILHIETSSKNCSVAVSYHRELLSLCEKTSQDYKQSENLHTYIEWALEGAGITLRDLDAISLGKGPGSYTGLRIGTASAKGFCFGLGIPLLAVNSLETMAAPFLGQGYDAVIPLVDARRMEVYCTVFEGTSGEMLTETNAKILDETSFCEYADKKILFVGDGAAKAQNLLKLPLAEYNEKIYPSAKYLISRAVEKYTAGDFEDITYFEPFYLKDFHGVKKSQQSPL